MGSAVFVPAGEFMSVESLVTVGQEVEVTVLKIEVSELSLSAATLLFPPRSPLSPPAPHVRCFYALGTSKL